MHPRVYNGIAKQIFGHNRSSDFKNPEMVAILLGAVSRDLFKTDITWGKIVSMFSIAGGLAIDCVRQGHAEYLPKLVDSVTEVIEDELVPWINDNGGWVGLANQVRPPEDFSFTGRVFIGIVCLSTLFLIVLIFKNLGLYLFPNIFNFT